jgi:2-amino-4-hydroxy-6-hydroxymethyldihydropteridine diphosphokinase
MTARPPTRVALGLGSNVGDRVGYLRAAIEHLRSSADLEVIAVSPFAETRPVGGPEQPDFINAVVVIETALSPGDVLALAQSCERYAERVRTERWGPRTLDVDVLAYDGVVQVDEQLTLPHPRAVERAFVLLPWAAIAPDFVVEGRTVAQWAAAVEDDGVHWLHGGGA